VKATLPKVSTDNARNYSNEKELIDYFKVVAFRNGEFFEPIDCRCWMGRSNQASTVYASIWINDRKNDRWYAGRGTAGGGGYHKQSAAIQEALTSAGVTLYGSAYPPRNGQTENLNKQAHIDGVGETAVRAALEAIARALGYRKFTIVEG
jgi:hypothetical protein